MFVSVPSKLTAREGDGAVRVCATLLGETIETSFSINLMTVNGTGSCTNIILIQVEQLSIVHFSARSGSEYIPIHLSKMFLAGSHHGSTICVNITIIDDKVLGSAKNFSVILRAYEPFVRLGVTRTVITIIENYGEYAL